MISPVPSGVLGTVALVAGAPGDQPFGAAIAGDEVTSRLPARSAMNESCGDPPPTLRWPPLPARRGPG